MSVPAPAINWPAQFKERGPAEDPGILMTGRAQIAGVCFKITALRMHAGQRTPDYRPDVPQKAYETMDGLLDDIEDLVDSIKPELLAFNDAQYLLWMVPQAHT